jgi:hypothetical protein
LHSKSPGQPEKKIRKSFKFFFLAGGALFIGAAVLGIYSRNASTLELQHVPKMMASNSSELSSLNRTLRPWISLIQRR